MTRQLPFIPITASFLLPKLVGIPGKCVWKCSPRAAHVTDFTLNVPNPSELTAICDQVVTFQLEGRIGGESEKIRGRSWSLAFVNVCSTRVGKRNGRPTMGSRLKTPNRETTAHLPSTRIKLSPWRCTGTAGLGQLRFIIPNPPPSSNPDLRGLRI